MVELVVSAAAPLEVPAYVEILAPRMEMVLPSNSLAPAGTIITASSISSEQNAIIFFIGIPPAELLSQ